MFQRPRNMHVLGGSHVSVYARACATMVCVLANSKAFSTTLNSVQKNSIMITTKMTYENSHLFMHTPYGKWLVDTGAPRSFSPGLRLSFNQNDYHRGIQVPETYMGISISTLTDLVGVDFHGLLGTDILNEYDILWNIEAETMQLTENDLDASSLELVGTTLTIGNIRGVPHFGCDIKRTGSNDVFRYGCCLQLSNQVERTITPTGDGS